MFVILVYDIGEKRVGKMLKLCREYLTWVQNSVFEGSIREGQLEELLMRAKDMMDVRHDSIILYEIRQKRWFKKKIIGVERNDTSVFL